VRWEVENFPPLKSGKVKGVRFATLEAICAYLECKPGDALDYEPDDAEQAAVAPLTAAVTPL
jgi:DNA-binding Xre family transcriptional regulator